METMGGFALDSAVKIMKGDATLFCILWKLLERRSHRRVWGSTAPSFGGNDELGMEGDGPHRWRVGGECMPGIRRADECTLHCELCTYCSQYADPAWDDSTPLTTNLTSRLE